MTAVQPPLFAPGWDLEPCADADEQAFVDLHGPQPGPSPVGTPLWEYGRSFARPDIEYWRDIADINTGGLL